MPVLSARLHLCVSHMHAHAWRGDTFRALVSNRVCLHRLMWHCNKHLLYSTSGLRTFSGLFRGTAWQIYAEKVLQNMVFCPDQDGRGWSSMKPLKLKNTPGWFQTSGSTRRTKMKNKWRRGRRWSRLDREAVQSYPFGVHKHDFTSSGIYKPLQWNVGQWGWRMSHGWNRFNKTRHISKYRDGISFPTAF